jgi:CHAT domain-containing protein/Tfp pilus assembly protein PilF
MTHYRFFRTYVKIIALFVFLAALSSWHTAIEPVIHGHEPIGTESRQHKKSLRLTPQDELERELRGDEEHVYRIELEMGQFLSVRFKRLGTPLRATLSDPDGIQQRSVICDRNGPQSVSFVSSTSGAHYLRVGSLATGHLPGGYEIKTQVRRAVPGDEITILVEDAISEAGSLLAKGDADSCRKAIGKLLDAITKTRSSGDVRQEGCIRTTIGGAYLRLGETEEALKQQQEALLLFRRAEDDPGIAAALSRSGAVHLQIGDSQLALSLFRDALSISQEVKDLHGQGEALHNLGDAYYDLGQMHSAVDYFTQSLAIRQEVGDLFGQANTYLYLGYTYSLLRYGQKALESYNEALSRWDALNDLRGQAVTRRALANQFNSLGENQRALNLLDDARRQFAMMEDRTSEAATLNGMGQVYFDLNDTQAAQRYYQEAREKYREAHHLTGEAASLTEIGRCQHARGEIQEALTTFDQALTASRSLGNPLMEANILGDIGRIHESMGETDKALEIYEQALKLKRAAGDRMEEAYTLNDLGRVFSAAGQQEKALDYYGRALELNQAVTDRLGESQTLFNMARLMRDRGDLSEACRYIEASLELSESVRDDVASHELRTSFFASVHQRHAFFIDLLMQQHARWPDGQHSATAFLASERARARTLLEGLAEAQVDIRHGIDPDLLQREHSLRRKLDAKAERHFELLAGDADESELEEIAGSIRRLTTEYAQLQAIIRSKSPRYAALMDPQPSSLEEVQKHVLDGESLLLEYALGEERSFLWAVTKKVHQSYELPTRHEIEESARRVYELLTARQPKPEETVREYRTRIKESDSQYWQQSSRLSDMVLGPVADQLGDKRLLVVSDGALQYVPFGALPVPGATHEDDEPVPLLVEHEIVRLPSASTLAVLRRDTEGRKTPIKSVAVLADPVFELDDPRVDAHSAEIGTASEKDLPERLKPAPVASELHRALRDIGFMQGNRLRIPRLPATRLEAEAIVAAASPEASFKAFDFMANHATATSPELEQYRIVHFATHGLLNNEHPGLSGIILSMVDEWGRPQNGFLRLHDIYNLDLPVELVVLSACNSGLGKQVRGEGLVGIVRGFMYAGAERVVASLWKVDDEATGILMKLFYREMLKKGLPPAAALRQAQIAMWRESDWHQPFYWAAFVLQGEWM